MLSHYKKETKFCLLYLNVNNPMIDYKFLCLVFLMTGYNLLASFSLVLFSFHFGGSCYIHAPRFQLLLFSSYYRIICPISSWPL